MTARPVQKRRHLLCYRSCFFDLASLTSLRNLLYYGTKIRDVKSLTNFVIHRRVNSVKISTVIPVNDQLSEVMVTRQDD